MMSIKRRLAVAASSLGAMLLGSLALAQTQSSNVTTQTHDATTTTPTVWYDERWVWAIGVAVFLIIVIALTTRSRRV
jgi:hypothetical protein